MYLLNTKQTRPVSLIYM